MGGFNFAFCFRDANIDTEVLVTVIEDEVIFHSYNSIYLSRKDYKIDFCSGSYIEDFKSRMTSDYFIKNKFYYIYLDRNMTCHEVCDYFLEDLKYRLYQKYISLVSETIGQLIVCMDTLKSGKSDSLLKVGEEIIRLDVNETRTLIESKIKTLKSLLQ